MSRRRWGRWSRRWRRSMIAYWTVAVALAAGTGLTVANLVGDASAAAARYGSLRSVWVASRAVDAGAVLEGSDVERRGIPVAFLPAGPLAGAPAGHTALVALVAGEVVTAAKVAPSGLKGVAALLPEGRRALAVPVGPGTPPLQPGDRVDVLATFDVDGEEVPTVLVAQRAPVLAVASDEHPAVTIAVSAREAPRVAFAIAKGAVTLALTSPGR